MEMFLIHWTVIEVQLIVLLARTLASFSEEQLCLNNEIQDKQDQDNELTE